ncbi:50S ribosomal protein L18 [Mycoplasmatota bacterium]|nr:50S ribosomal protein L18 [Mycoplasmatota bacterium]
MIKKFDRNGSRMKRRRRIRGKISGTPSVPRLSIFRSNTNIFAQVIDDENGVTLASASSLKLENGANIEGAKEVGTLVSKVASEKGITKVVFDRSGYLYHGRVKALAEAAREAGLEF